MLCNNVNKYRYMIFSIIRYGAAALSYDKSVYLVYDKNRILGNRKYPSQELVTSLGGGRSGYLFEQGLFWPYFEAGNLPPESFV